MRNVTKALVAVTLVATGLMLPGGAVGASHTEAGPGRQPIRLPGRRVAIYNLVGNVEVVPGTGDTVEVDVRPGGPDAGKLRIATGEIDGRQTLRVIYPADVVLLVPSLFERLETARGLRVHDDGTFGAAVEPGGRQVMLATPSLVDAKTGNVFTGTGDVVISGVENLTLDVRRCGLVLPGRRMEAYAHLTVRVPSERHVELHMGMGAVNASGARGALEVAIGHGDVSVRVPRGLGAKVDLHTAGGGDVDVRVPLTNAVREANRVHGTLGDGSGHVHVKTDYGRVRLLPARQREEQPRLPDRKREERAQRQREWDKVRKRVERLLNDMAEHVHAGDMDTAHNTLIKAHSVAQQLPHHPLQECTPAELDKLLQTIQWLRQSLEKSHLLPGQLTRRQLEDLLTDP